MAPQGLSCDESSPARTQSLSEEGAVLSLRAASDGRSRLSAIKPVACHAASARRCLARYVFFVLPSPYAPLHMLQSRDAEIFSGSFKVLFEWLLASLSQLRRQSLLPMLIDHKKR